MEKITFLSMDRVMLNSDKNIPISDSFVGSNLKILTLWSYIGQSPAFLTSDVFILSYQVIGHFVLTI